MRRPLKISLIISAVILVVALVFLLAGPFLVDPQKHRARIEKMLSDTAGRPVRLGEDLKVSLVPWAGLSSSNLEIHSPPGFSQTNLLTVDSLEIRARFLPLLSGRLEIVSFRLIHPKLFLERNADGRGNWELPPAGPESPPTGSGPEAAPKGPARDFRVTLLAAADLAVKDGEVTYLDQASGRQVSLSGLNLALVEFEQNHLVPINASARVGGLDVSLTGKLGPISANPLAGDLPVSLEITAENTGKLTVNGKIFDLAINPQYELALEAGPINLREIFSAAKLEFPFKVQDPKTFEKVGLNLQLSGGFENISVSQGLLTLDDSTLKFTGRASWSEKPEIKFDLEADRIDLDRYLPEDDQTNAPQPQQTSPPAAESEETPPPSGPAAGEYAWLKDLSLTGNLKAAQVKLIGFTVQDISVAFKGRDGLFRADPISFLFYQGKTKALLEADVTQSPPKSRYEVESKGIDMKQVFLSLKSNVVLTGVGDAQAKLHTLGTDKTVMVPNLNGEGLVIVRNGSVEGLNFLKFTETAGAVLGLDQQLKSLTQAAFSYHELPFTIKNGVLSTPRIYAKGKDITVTGQGRADLVRQTLSFRIENQTSGGLMIPVVVGGTFENPTFKIDLLSLKGLGQKTKELEKALPKLKKIVPKLPF